MPAIIPKIEYRGLKSIPLQEVEYLTDVKDGRSVDRIRMAIAVNEIQRLYAQRGYLRATVTANVQELPKGNKVIIEIFEGLKPRLRSIVFQSNRYFSDQQLIRQLARKPRVGVSSPAANDLDQIVKERRFPIPHDLIGQDREKLQDAYRAQGFLDCRVKSYLVGDNPGDLQLIYHFEEGTRYKMRNISFFGNKRISSDGLREGLLPMSGKPILRASIEEGKKIIIDRYRAIGCKDARIVSATFQATGPATLDQLDLVYEIAEPTP